MGESIARLYNNDMKKLLAAMFVGLLMVGCGEPDLDDKETLDGIIASAIDVKKLQERGQKGEELNYAPNEQTPYTGWVKEMYDNGQIKMLAQVKDGKLEGSETWWHRNGQKRWETTYKDGEKHGLATGWYENGQKGAEQNFKDGKLWTAVVWKPNGEKCPHTNLVDGNGILVGYREDGTEYDRTTFNEEERKRAEEFDRKYGKFIAKAIDWWKLQPDVTVPYFLWLEGAVDGPPRTREQLLTILEANASPTAEFSPLNDPAARRPLTALRQELAYAPNQETPYTGWAKRMYDNGQIEWLIQYKDGKWDGLVTRWYENGQKRSEANWKDGKEVVD
jgi:antitoxin component YwqK of YwqJK toxin-antitoxin module